MTSMNLDSLARTVLAIWLALSVLAGCAQVRRDAVPPESPPPIPTKEDHPAREDGVLTLDEAGILFELTDDRRVDGELLLHFVCTSFGEVVAGLGDLDGDGCSDLAAGPDPVFDPFDFDSDERDGLEIRSGRTGEELVRLIHPDAPMEYTFRCAIPMGDLDGDGVGELAVSTGTASGFFGSTDGCVRVLSGALSELRAGGAPLFELDPPGEVDLFGLDLACAGDLDGDGLDDLLVAAPYSPLVGATFGVFLHSGADGALLRSFRSETIDRDGFGRALCAGSDFDGDGVGDLAVGAPLDDRVGRNSGSAWIFSGADGGAIACIAGPLPRNRFGFDVDWAGDVDGDGLADLLVGAPGRDEGSAFLVTGATREPREIGRGARKGARFGARVRGGADFDRDGTPDLVVGAPGGFGDSPHLPGSISILSGSTGAPLARVEGPAARGSISPAPPREAFGATLDLAGDVDLDGWPDLIVGSPRWGGEGSSSGDYDGGRIYVLSGRQLVAGEDG